MEETVGLSNENEINIDNSLIIDLKHLTFGSKLAEGASSIVYKGWYKEMPVAVKKIQPQRLGSAVSLDQKEKFAREVKMLSDSRVKHDKLVTLIGASMKPDMLIVMEFMEGGSLKDYLFKKQTCSLKDYLFKKRTCPDLKQSEDFELEKARQSINLALDITRAMEHLHANGIIHRDLKPGNLVLTADRRSLKVADFGLAQEEENVKEMIPEAGSDRWMAPELFSTAPLKPGQKRYDHKVDIYSFSIVLWELLKNKTPFKEMCPTQIAFTVAKNNRPSVDKLPEYLVRLLKSCWAEDPTIRPEFTVITAYLLDILKAETDEERSFIQLQVADSPGTIV